MRQRGGLLGAHRSRAAGEPSRFALSLFACLSLLVLLPVWCRCCVFCTDVVCAGCVALLSGAACEPALYHHAVGAAAAGISAPTITARTVAVVAAPRRVPLPFLFIPTVPCCQPVAPVVRALLALAHPLANSCPKDKSPFTSQTVTDNLRCRAEVTSGPTLLASPAAPPRRRAGEGRGRRRG